MIKHMAESFKDARQDYSDSLNEIEQHFSMEREKILLRNKNDINSLFKEQRDLENEKMRERAEREEKYTEELEELRTNDANDQ